MEIQPILEMGRADILCDLVEQGMGISFLPDYLTESAIQKGTMVRLHVLDDTPDLWIQLLRHKDKWVSPPLEAVITHFTACLSKGTFAPPRRI